MSVSARSIDMRVRHDAVFARPCADQHEALERKQLVQVALSALNDRERKVVIGHLVEGFTHKELCQGLNVTQARCQQIELRAIVKMRAAVERKPLPKVEGLKAKARKPSISCKPPEMSASEREARKRANRLMVRRLLMGEWIRARDEWFAKQRADEAERRRHAGEVFDAVFPVPPDPNKWLRGHLRPITEETKRLLIKVSGGDDTL